MLGERMSAAVGTFEEWQGPKKKQEVCVCIFMCAQVTETYRAKQEWYAAGVEG